MGPVLVESSVLAHTTFAPRKDCAPTIWASGTCGGEDACVLGGVPHAEPLA